MGWKLKVLEYGKIKSAEIEVSPLTLFVGDNNSGKSYLMALLWGIQNLGVSELISSVLREETKLEHELIGWIRAQVALACEQGEHIAQVCEIEKELQAFLREGLRQNKDNLVKKIFNSSDVKIKDLQIELKDLDKISLTFTKLKDRWGSEELDSLRIKNNTGTEYTIKLSEIEWGYQNNLIICMILSLAMEISIGEVNGIHENIYLPAARTGFMLTKDIINKAGRNAAFNIGVQQEEMIPFIRPINQFLDVVNDLSFDSKGDRGAAAIAEYLENYMAEGTVEMSTLPNKEVLYVPAGQEKGIPLRIVSAVVTEISPLILILKHKKRVKGLFYEEPEMCLHPQLQQKIARVICQLASAGVKMTLTTHSDIILQHINNMIRLSERQDAERICSELGYDSGDLLKAEEVKVYQLKSNAGEGTKVEELPCGKNGFAVPTFNDALDRIMEEAF
ncbi:MAG: AAA family ATPase [Lachnospiraceae bacterium]|nr:AAA family ATPase [Lachnospiraceae bacterium]